MPESRPVKSSLPASRFTNPASRILSELRNSVLSLGLLAVVTACAAAGEGAPEPKPRPKPARVKEDQTTLEFNAKEVRYLRKEKAAVLSGSAWAACRGILLEAENIVVFTEKKQAWAEGGVRLTEKGGRLLAEEIFYDFRVHRGRAKGVRLEVGRIEAVPDERAAGEKAPGGKTRKAPAGEVWSIGFGQCTPKKWYLSAPEIRRLGPGKWVLIRPRISSCEFAEPHWCFQASSANYLPGRRIESFNNVLKLGRVPVLYIPYLARDLAHDYPWTTWQFGNSSQWGPYVLSKWGLDLPHGDWILQPENLYIDADWRRDRGLAYGVDLRYAALPHGGGLFDTYFIKEDSISEAEDRERAGDDVERRTVVYQNLRDWGAPKVRGRPKRLYPENLLFAQRRAFDGFTPANLAPELYSDEQRFRLTVRHRQDLFLMRNDLQHDPVYKLDLTVEYTDYSDRGFSREYFRDEARGGPRPVTFAMLRNQTDMMSVAMVVQPRINGWVDQTEYLPELRFDVPQRPLAGGFLLTWEAGVGRLFRHFDEDAGFTDFDAGRAYLRLIGSRPVKLGPLTIKPYAGTDQAWYSDHRAGGEITRGALLYGADACFRLYGVYNVQSPRLNIHGLRHVIEPRVYYRGVSDPTHDPVRLYDFDERDDLYKADVAGAGLFQKIQVKRRDKDGALRVVDLAGLDFAAEGFADQLDANRYNNGDMLLPMKVRSFFRPSGRLRIWNRLEIDAHGVGLLASATGVTYSQSRRLSLTLSHRTITEDRRREISGSNYLSARVDMALGPGWRASAGTRYEFDEPDRDLGEQGLDNAFVRLLRDLHCWQVGVGYSTERRDDSRNRAFTFTLAPKGRPRNLVKGSDQLLPDTGDFSRMPWRALPGEAAGALRLLPPEKPPVPRVVEEKDGDDDEPPGAE